jgi:predicted AAA+ superfamily ATPase
MSDEIELMARIAAALERMSPTPPGPPDWTAADAFVWHADVAALVPITRTSALKLDLLQGIDQQRDTLLNNTRRFAQGFSANNALLWGARGMGKSALVKAVHRHINVHEHLSLKLVEVHPKDLHGLDGVLARLETSAVRALVYCDDLAFTQDDEGYRALKALLDGGVAGRPENVLFYATSNRRHLMPREMIENERSTAIHADEAVEEKVSLSDRFGLWLGFYTCTQDVYLKIVEGYMHAFQLPLSVDDLRARALTWAAGRGGRSGRVAWQFTVDLAGELGVKLG